MRTDYVPRRRARLRHFVRRVPPARARAARHRVAKLSPIRAIAGLTTRLKYEAIAQPGQSTSCGTRAKKNREGRELPVFLRLLIVLGNIVLAVVLGLAVLLREILLRDVLAEILVFLIGHRARLYLSTLLAWIMARITRHTTSTKPLERSPTPQYAAVPFDRRMEKEAAASRAARRSSRLRRFTREASRDARPPRRPIAWRRSGPFHVPAAPRAIRSTPKYRESLGRGEILYG